MSDERPTRPRGSGPVRNFRPPRPTGRAGLIRAPVHRHGLSHPYTRPPIGRSRLGTESQLPGDQTPEPTNSRGLSLSSITGSLTRVIGEWLPFTGRQSSANAHSRPSTLRRRATTISAENRSTEEAYLPAPHYVGESPIKSSSRLRQSRSVHWNNSEPAPTFQVKAPSQQHSETAFRPTTRTWDPSNPLSIIEAYKEALSRQTDNFTRPLEPGTDSDVAKSSEDSNVVIADGDHSVESSGEAAVKPADDVTDAKENLDADGASKSVDAEENTKRRLSDSSDNPAPSDPKRPRVDASTAADGRGKQSRRGTAPTENDVEDEEIREIPHIELRVRPVVNIDDIPAARAKKPGYITVDLDYSDDEEPEPAAFVPKLRPAPNGTLFRRPPDVDLEVVARRKQLEEEAAAAQEDKTAKTTTPAPKMDGKKSPTEVEKPLPFSLGPSQTSKSAGTTDTAAIPLFALPEPAESSSPPAFSCGKSQEAASNADKAETLFSNGSGKSPFAFEPPTVKGTDAPAFGSTKASALVSESPFGTEQNKPSAAANKADGPLSTAFTSTAPSIGSDAGSDTPKPDGVPFKNFTFGKPAENGIPAAGIAPTQASTPSFSFGGFGADTSGKETDTKKSDAGSDATKAPAFSFGAPASGPKPSESASSSSASTGLSGSTPSAQSSTEVTALFGSSNKRKGSSDEASVDSISSFKFGQGTKATEGDDATKVAAPAPLFGSTTPALGAATPADPPKLSFGFGSTGFGASKGNSEPKESTGPPTSAPLFAPAASSSAAPLFGKPAESSTTSSALPFGTPKSAEPSAAVNGFALGSTKPTGGINVGGFAFGKSADGKAEIAGGFGFGKPSENNKPESSSSFSFGKPAETPKSFGFGTTASSSSLPFGQAGGAAVAPTTSSTPFSFGANATPAPATPGLAASNTLNAGESAKINFGAPASFQFAPSQPQAAGTFMFGAQSQPNPQSQPGGFGGSFGATTPNTNGAFSFGPPAGAAANAGNMFAAGMPPGQQAASSTIPGRKIAPLRRRLRR